LVSCEKSYEKVNEANQNKDFLDGEHILDSLYKNYKYVENKDESNLKLLEISFRYEDLELFDKSKRILKENLNDPKVKKNSLFSAHIHRYLGDIYSKTEVLDSAYYHYIESEKLYKKDATDSLNLGKVILYKSGLLFNKGITTESEIETIRALDIFNRIGETRLKYEATVRMAILLKDLKDYESAKNYYEKIPFLLQKLENEKYDAQGLKRSWLSYYNNISNFYINIEDYSTAIQYLGKALDLEYAKDYPRIYALILNNYAICLSNLPEKKEAEKVKKILLKSLKIRDSIHNISDIIASRITLSKFYLTEKDTLNAVREIRESYKLATAEKNIYDRLMVLNIISNIETVNKEAYLKEYLSLKDSLKEFDYQTRNKFARIAYETKDIAKQNTILSRNNKNLLYLVIITLFGIVLTIVIYRLKMQSRTLKYQRSEQENILNTQKLLAFQEKIESDVRNEERNRIAQDLHDGIINKIFTVRLNLETLPIENRDKKNALLAELNDCQVQIRKISHNLNNFLDYKSQSFSNLIHELVLSQQATNGTIFKCSIDTFLDLEKLSLNYKTQIYLVLQEVLQNVNKHAKAKNCFVILLKSEEELILKIHDDGIGFDAEKIKFGIGLKSIAQRVKKLNGTLTITSNAKTTSFIIKHPLNN